MIITTEFEVFGTTIEAVTADALAIAEDRINQQAKAVAAQIAARLPLIITGAGSNSLRRTANQEAFQVVRGMMDAASVNPQFGNITRARFRMLYIKLDTAVPARWGR
jgi:hypothetical protein